MSKNNYMTLLALGSPVRILSINDQGLLLVDYIQAGEIAEEVHNKCTENRQKREGMDSVQCTFTQHIRYYWFVKVQQPYLHTILFNLINPEEQNA